MMTGQYCLYSLNIFSFHFIFSEDDTAELLRELQKIKRERAEEQARKVHEMI